MTGGHERDVVPLDTTDNDWSDEQEEALFNIVRWQRSSSNQQVKRLYGAAGTGKTTVACHLRTLIPNIVYGTFTGKAASILRKKGACDADTLDSLIYTRRIWYSCEEECESPPCKDPCRHARIHYGPKQIDYNGRLKDADLIVVDEVSMVDERMGRDLISFGKKILVVGDPYQLPPIHGEGFFTSDPPDIFLKKIHRQAEGSPIIQMATIIRNGGWLKSGVRGESSVVTSIETRDLPTYDIIIAGLHPMRRRVNRDLRKLLGFSGPPQVGDRLLCTRNSNGSRRMMNGTLWDVLEIHGTSDGFISMTLVDEFNEQTAQVEVLLELFEKDITDVPYSMGDSFTWGYCLTCHKSQASEWGRVLVFDQGGSFRDKTRPNNGYTPPDSGDYTYPNRWRYTAVTRASEMVTIIRRRP